MDGLNVLTAAARTVRIAGQTLRLATLTLSDFGEIENRILGQRPDPMLGFRERLAGQTPDERRESLGSLFDAMAQSSRLALRELDLWWQTAEGLGYRFWLMARKEQPWLTLDAAADLLRSLGSEDGERLSRAMAECHGWPEPWRFAVADAEDAGNDRPSLPWYRWAMELSRAYGWTPHEIGRLTIAQLFIYLGPGHRSASRQRMTPGEAQSLCQRHRDDRQRWIDQTMERIRHDS